MPPCPPKGGVVYLFLLGFCLLQNLNYLVFDYDYDTVAWDYIRDKCIELYPHNNGNIIVSLISGGLFFFDNETEMDEFFEIFNVRDITYAGGMYASTYNPDGECLTENT